MPIVVVVFSIVLILYHNLIFSRNKLLKKSAAREESDGWVEMCWLLL